MIKPPHEEPEDGEEFVPKPREPMKRRRRRKKDKEPNRLSPSQRKTVRWVTVTIPADAYVKLRELSEYYKTSMSKMFARVVDPVFDKVYEESMLLLRIEERRRKEEEEREAQRRDKPAGRTRF